MSLFLIKINGRLHLIEIKMKRITFKNISNDITKFSYVNLSVYIV